MADIIRALAQPAPQKRSIFHWAVVTQADPLRVRIVTEDAPLTVTPRSMVAGLEVSDVVRVEIAPDGDVIVIGRRGGSGVPDIPASKITSGTLDAARRWTGAPYREAAGKVATPASSSTAITGVYFANVTITFPAGRFTQVPIVTVGGHGGVGRVSVVGHLPASVTTGGFSARVINFGGAVDVTGEVHWHAVQMTDTNASG